MATLAIQLGVTVGVSLLSSALSPKPQLQRVDRGKLDDIRITFVEEGGFKPLVYGRRARLGGVIRWASKTQEHVQRTPGRSGGKGGNPQPGEPPTNTFSYTKSFAVRVCGNQIKAFRHVWESEELVLSLAGADGVGDYEAEDDANSLTNAAVVGASSASGGRVVRLNTSTGAIQFNGVGGFGPSTEFGFGYVASGTRTCQIWVNGVLARTVTLPGFGLGGPARVMWYRASDLDIPSGAGNTVRLVNTSSESGALLYIDRLYVNGDAQTGSEPHPTGIVNEDDPFPEDKDNPLPAYNSFLEADEDGFIEGTIVAGGQAQFELHLGTETQLQSPTIVAAEGAANVPAWRGDAYFVARDYLLKNGQPGNFTFEVVPLIQDLAEIMVDLFTQDGRATEGELDFSELAGTVSEGFIVHTRQELGAWIDQLQQWYGFDIVPVDGKIKAVKRGAAPSFTLTEEDLYAHHEGEARPLGPFKQSREDDRDAPATVDVLYLEPSAEKQFHTGAQHAQVQVGDSFDHDTLTFAVVGSPDEAHAVGRRWLDQKQLETRPLSFATGPKWRHLVPTDVGEIVTAGVTNRVRLVSSQAELLGLVQFKALPERASLYTQTGIGQRAQGRETPAVAFPANTFLVAADTVPLRQEDMGRLVVYVAGCGRGAGSFRGYHINKKDQNGEFERLGSSQRAATLGVVETASQSEARFGLEETREFVVKLYNGTLESRTLEEARAERVNLALYGKGARWEVIQFLSVEAQTPAEPFVAQYKVTGTVSGLFGTEVESKTHQDDDFFVLFDEAVQSFPMLPTDVTREQTFVAQSAGQALADAEAAGSVTFTYQGNSRKPLAIARVDLEEETGLAPRASDGSMLVSVHPRTNLDFIGDEYLLRLHSDDRTQIFHDEPFKEGVPVDALLITHRAGSTDKFDGASRNTASWTGNAISARSISLQQIRRTDNFVEATLRATGNGGATLGLIGASKDWKNAPGDQIDYQIAAVGGVAAGLYVRVPAVPPGLLINVGPYSSGSDARVRIELRGRQVFFFRDYRDSSTPALYVSELPPTFPLRLFLSIGTASPGGTAEGRDAILLTDPYPSVVVTAAQQQRFYGGLKKPMQVSLVQHSGVREVGYGFAWEGAI